MDVDKVRELVGDLAEQLASVSRNDEDLLVGRGWADELVAAVFPVEHPARAQTPDPECAECGETYPADDATWDPSIGADVCVSCADAAGLLDRLPEGPHVRVPTKGTPDAP